MIVEIRKLLNGQNSEGVKYIIPSGFCSAAAYLFYNHINPSDLIIGSQLRKSYMDLNRIVIDPKILVGKPSIRGTRLSVDFIFDLIWRRDGAKLKFCGIIRALKGKILRYVLRMPALLSDPKKYSRMKLV